MVSLEARGDILFVGLDRGGVVARDTRTGAECWSAPHPGGAAPAATRPIVPASGMDRAGYRVDGSQSRTARSRRAARPAVPVEAGSVPPEPDPLAPHPEREDWLVAGPAA